MKVSGINTPAKLSCSVKNSSTNNVKKTSSLNFCGNDSRKIGLAVGIGAALIGALIFLKLSPKPQKADNKYVDTFQKQAKTTSFSKNHKKDVILNRPSNKHYQAALKKQQNLEAA